MKNTILLPLAFSALILSVTDTNAQTTPITMNGREITVSADTVAQITVFEGRFVEGKTYLHWVTKDQQCDGTYIVYTSQDGLTFKALGNKKGIGIPVSVPISYYLQDENPYGGTTYYKLIHVAADNTYLVSEIISIPNENETFSKVK